MFRVTLFIFVSVVLFSFNSKDTNAQAQGEINIGSVPVMSDQEVLDWVPAVAQEVMTFGFHDYDMRLKASSRHFTTKGYDSFYNALKQARILDSVEANRQVVTLSIDGDVKIISYNESDLTWTVKLPVSVSYMAGDKKRTNQWALTLVIVHSTQSQNKDGLGITQWIAAPL